MKRKDDPQSGCVGCLSALFGVLTLVGIGYGFHLWIIFHYYGPLQRAARDGDLKKIQKLLDSGTPVDEQCKYKKWTALHAAADQGQWEAAKLLLDRGAAVDACDDQWNTPMHVDGFEGNGHSKSTEAGRNKVAALLLEHGAAVNAQGRYNMTPLMRAVEGDDIELVRMLLKHGADPTMKDGGGATAFDRAASWNDPQLSILLQPGNSVRAATSQP